MPRRNKPLTISIGVLLAAAALIAAAFWIPSLLAAPAGDRPVAEVNGDVVTAAELAHFAKLHRASVMEAFLTEEGAALDEGFWSRDAGGTTPMETLRRKALRDAIAMKTELQLAREYGVADDISYGSLLALMEKENSRREAAVAKGEPLYGPASFEEDSFIGFYRSKLAASVKEIWAEKELAPSERELEAFYEGIKTTLSPMEERMTYETTAIVYRQDGEESEALREEASRIAEAVRQRLLAGEAAAEYDSLPPGISIIREGESELNEDTASRLYKSGNALYEALRSSSADQPVPPVVDDRAGGRYIVANVTGRHAGKAPQYEKVRDIVRKVYVEQNYTELIRARAETASVKLLPGYYEELTGLQ